MELADLRHDALGDFDAGDVKRLAGFLRFDEKAQVGGVREQAALAGLDRIGETFACEHFVFEDAEAAAVEGQRAGVGDPERAKRTAGSGGGAPERNFIGDDVGLRDGNEGGLIFFESDAVFEFVFKEVAEILPAGGCAEQSAGNFDVSSVWSGEPSVTSTHSNAYASTYTAARA